MNNVEQPTPEANPPKASPSRAKARGTAAETAVAATLRTNGYPHVERRARNGSRDRGDITGIPKLVIEIKNCARDQLPQWLKEAEKERGHDNAEIAVVWHKLRGTTNPKQWAVSMTGETFLKLLNDWKASHPRETP